MVVDGCGWTWMDLDGCGWWCCDYQVECKKEKNTYLMHGGQPACGFPMTLEVVVIVVVVVLWWQQLTVDVRTDTLHADALSVMWMDRNKENKVSDDLYLAIQNLPCPLMHGIDG